jgi:predicted SprT family Zn-dependent metalloprotease
MKFQIKNLELFHRYAPRNDEWRWIVHHFTRPPVVSELAFPSSLQGA